MIQWNGIGRRIRETREKNGITQQGMADALGVKRETVNQWESESRHIKDKDLCMIAPFLGVTSDYLLGLTAIKTRDPQLQDACEYTGLSESAVSFLREFGRPPEIPKDIISDELMKILDEYRGQNDLIRQRFLPIINALLSQEALGHLLVQFRHLQRDCDKLKGCEILSLDDISGLLDRIEIDEFRLTREALKTADCLFSVQEIKKMAADMCSRKTVQMTNKEGDNGEGNAQG